METPNEPQKPDRSEVEYALAGAVATAGVAFIMTGTFVWLVGRFLARALERTPPGWAATVGATVVVVTLATAVWAAVKHRA